MQVKEWLCLNCQVQRARSASEHTGPPMKPHNEANKMSPSAVHPKTTAPKQVETLKKEPLKSDASPKMESPVPDALQKKESSTPGSPQKTHPTVTPTAKAAKGPDNETKAGPAPGQKTIPGSLDKQKPNSQATQPELKESKDSRGALQESGLSGSKTGPDTSKTTESMGGKMFGFGSSIFSSASTLISSAVREESRTTPPGSRKMSAPAQVSPKISAMPKISPKSTPTVSPKMSPSRAPTTASQKPGPEKKPDVSKQEKEDKNAPVTSKTTTTLQNPPKAGQTTCPLCKVELNMSSKDPPNYNTCTECKTTVCNQCGFNSMNTGEVSTAVQHLSLKMYERFFIDGCTLSSSIFNCLY